MAGPDGGSDGGPLMAPRQRLDQVDAMRPVKQVGVVSTHAVIFFAPAWASVTAGAGLLLLHVAREAFFFISACMLTYAYMNLKRSDLKRFYWRRFVSVGIPYLCWTLIYFFWGFRDTTYTSVGPRARAPGGPALARVLPAVLPAGDHAVLRGVPAGARAAEADQGASRPGHRGRGRSPGGDLHPDSLERAAEGAGHLRAGELPRVRAVSHRRRGGRVPPARGGPVGAQERAPGDRADAARGDLRRGRLLPGQRRE